MSIRNDLLNQGYENRSPTQKAYEIDSHICHESICDNCKHIGMEYHSRIKPESYRAFAVCPNCGLEEEF